MALPVNSDGPANALDLERMGVAEVIDYFDVNEENLLLAVQKVLEDQSYRDNARKFGSLLTDQMTNPLERAVWHIEHLMRHPGLQRHIHPPVHNLSWYQYFLLDVLAFLTSFLLIFVFIFYKLGTSICSWKNKQKLD